MHRTVLVVVQLVLAWLIAAAVMPPVLLVVPAVRGPRAGTAVTGIVLLGLFLILRRAWPSHRAP